MTEADNKAVVHALIESWNRDDLAGITRLWAPEMVHHGRDGTLPAAEVAAEMGRFMRAFTGVHMEVHSMVAEGDLVNTRMTVHFSHTGDYLGVPATGRRLRCGLMGQLRIVDGLVVEHWGIADGLHLLEQLGVLPESFLSATA
ncbi:hypothetical protein GCM10027290_63570 [Micromonospora sonneratiae]|uniref:Ester cyclase n=1 Tax=Micromonospora sonneratiae TaxID=1184706 RepID=A0ABW3YKV9_9ACTN